MASSQFHSSLARLRIARITIAGTVIVNGVTWECQHTCEVYTYPADGAMVKDSASGWVRRAPGCNKSSVQRDKSMKKMIVIAAIAVVALVAWRFASESSTQVAPIELVSDAGDVANNTTSQPANSAQDENGIFSTGATKPEVARTSPRSIDTAGQRSVRVFESRMLTNNMVNDNAMKMLQAKNFDEVVNALDAENAGRYNPVTETYRNQIEDTLGSVGKHGQIDRFACGSNICMASIRTPSDATWFKDWYENLQPAATAPIGALTGHDVTLPGGVIEHRILFTTQPGSAGFALKSVPPPQT